MSFKNVFIDSCRSYILSSEGMVRYKLGHNFSNRYFTQLVDIGSETFLNSVLEQLYEFIISYYKNMPYAPDDDYGHFVPKFKIPALHNSILIFKRKKEHSTFNVIIKSRCRVSNPVHGERLFKKGSFKVVKLFSVLFTLNARPCDACFSSLRFECVDFCPVVTVSRTVNVGLCQETHLKKSHALKKAISDFPKSRQYLEWDDFLSYYDPVKRCQRLIGYQKKRGIKECDPLGTIFDSWSTHDRLRGILSFLASVRGLLEKNHWPCDLKFANMCVDVNPNGPLLNCIDYIPNEQSGSTFTLFKVLTISDRLKTCADPTGTHRCVKEISFSQYSILLECLLSRVRLDEQNYKILVIQFIYELIYNIFFIWNRTLRSGACPKKYYLSGCWDTNYLTLANLQRMCMGCDFGGLFVSTSLCGFFDKNVNVILNSFFDRLLERIQNLISSHKLHVAPDLIHIPTREWFEEFKTLIVMFPLTPSPFPQTGIEIRRLMSI